MAMRVDPAGHHQPPCRIDDARALQPGPDRGDALADYADIGLRHLGGGDDRATFDDEVEFHAGGAPAAKGGGDPAASAARWPGRAAALVLPS